MLGVLAAVKVFIMECHFTEESTGSRTPESLAITDQDLIALSQALAQCPDFHLCPSCSVVPDLTKLDIWLACDPAIVIDHACSVAEFIGIDTDVDQDGYVILKVWRRRG